MSQPLLGQLNRSRERNQKGRDHHTRQSSPRATSLAVARGTD